MKERCKNYFALFFHAVILMCIKGIYLYTYDKLISWVEDIKEKNHSSATALCIIKDNKIVLEHYSGYHSNTSTTKRVTASSQFNVASARKSYLGLMIAYALL